MEINVAFKPNLPAPDTSAGNTNQNYGAQQVYLVPAGLNVPAVPPNAPNAPALAYREDGARVAFWNITTQTWVLETP